MAFHMLSLLNSAPMIVYKILTCQLIFYKAFSRRQHKKLLQHVVFMSPYFTSSNPSGMSRQSWMGRSSLRHPDGLVAFTYECLLDLDPQVEPPTFKIRGSMLTAMTGSMGCLLVELSCATRSHLSRRSLGPVLCFVFSRVVGLVGAF